MPTVDRLGWEAGPNDDDRVRQLRGLAIGVLGGLAGNPDVVGRAREVVERPDAVSADVVAASISVVAGSRGEDEFDQYLARATDATKSPQDQLRYLYALGDFPSDELVLRAADLAMSSTVRPQNSAVRAAARAAQP